MAEDVLYGLFFLFSLECFLSSSRLMGKILALVCMTLVSMFWLTCLFKFSFLVLIYLVLLISGLMVLFMYLTSIGETYDLNLSFGFSNLIMSGFMFLILVKVLGLSTKKAYYDELGLWNLSEQGIKIFFSSIYYMWISVLLLYMLLLLFLVLEFLVVWKASLRSEL